MKVDVKIKSSKTTSIATNVIQAKNIKEQPTNSIKYYRYYDRCNSNPCECSYGDY